ncbi:MAG: TetR/AcrR family transcriptional regulator [bacterium]|nr:TetR/AcrR family transcriptional regulator [bacterium]
MPKTDGEKTKQRILVVAEELFSKNGFDGTSVDRIAKTANVNKALIYYHFKNKNDIVASMFKSIIDDIKAAAEIHIEADAAPAKMTADYKEKIKNEIEYLDKRKKIISIMFMEALKSSDSNNALFQCAQLVIDNEMKKNGKVKKGQDITLTRGDNPEFIFEFFTGFIPIISYVIFKEKFAEYFKCDKANGLDLFLDAFKRSHLDSHFPTLPHTD